MDILSPNHAKNNLKDRVRRCLAPANFLMPQEQDTCEFLHLYLRDPRRVYPRINKFFNVLKTPKNVLNKVSFGYGGKIFLFQIIQITRPAVFFQKLDHLGRISYARLLPSGFNDRNGIRVDIS